LEAWDSLLLAAGKRDTSLVLGLGTPGLDRNNALYHLREKVMEGAELPGFRFKEYAADPGCDINDREQWRKANPALVAGFLREAALVTSLGLVPESHFRVFRLGQWVDGVEGWLGADGRAVWDLGGSDYELSVGGRTWVGVDVGLKRDSTAVVAVQYRDDEPKKLHAECRIWLPKTDEPVDVTDVMGHLRTLADRYKVEAISYDPRFFDVPAKLLEDEGLKLVEIPQSLERMTPAVGALYELLRSNGMTHSRAKDFGQQVLNAIPRLNERGFTLSKGKSRGRIDAAVALALAVDRAQHKKKPRSPLVVM
jgi:phage terminase large subunit-like protein